MAPLFLIHGGLWELMDAERFWRTPGIVAGLEAQGLTVFAPDRPQRPSGWDEEVAALSTSLPGEPVTVVGASNGCTAAVRLALAHPEVVERLLLAWPATGGDTSVDIRTQTGLLEAGAPGSVVKALLRAETLRGVKDEELAGLRIPVAVLPSVPESPSHQRKTVDALLKLIPGSRELAGSPEPPTQAFPAHKDELVATLAAFVS
jgi:pimeloyl-ACP methyl ester carboxylesterase